MTLHPTVAAVTDRIRQRNAPTRSAYLARLEPARRNGPIRKGLSRTNLAHAFAAFEPHDKAVLREARWPNLACVGGSWLTPKAALAAGDWEAISALARQSAALNRR